MAASSSSPQSDIEATLTRVRALRSQDLEAAVEAISEKVGQEAERLGTDVHGDLGLLWLEYGDITLELVERAVEGGESNHPATAEKSSEVEAVEAAKAAGHDQPAEAAKAEGDDSEDEDGVESDLELAWQCLETARRCLEMQTPPSIAALAFSHGRLADLLMLQGHHEDAIDESRTCLAKYKLARANQSKSSSSTSSPSSTPVSKTSSNAFSLDLDEALKTAVARLAEALIRCGRQEEAKTLAQEVFGQSDSKVDGKDAVNVNPRVIESRIGFAPENLQGKEIQQVSVRKKRPREESLNEQSS
eukprot:TRINITY_DN100355_c0_g1_i1.p1 TRINITY_DN100355_c0_g1~~TRINITY_DN100355_c0_g1_i1.p1  ORF type:complete len:303 (-),score=75.93 TRINITY_DN100355_c0_g1_i1:93-1001(-)